MLPALARTHWPDIFNPNVVFLEEVYTGSKIQMFNQRDLEMYFQKPH